MEKNRCESFYPKSERPKRAGGSYGDAVSIRAALSVNQKRLPESGGKL
jgi:hypothetical protein